MSIIRLLDLRGSAVSDSEVARLIPRAQLDIVAAMDLALSVMESVRTGGAKYIRELTKQLDDFDPEP